MSEKIVVGVVFGGVSVEHEVSVITALQAAAALDTDRYHPVALYISKSGLWYTGDHLLDISEFKSVDEALRRAQIVTLEQERDGGVAAVARRKGAFRRDKRIQLNILFLGLHV